jgi:hypothetical protein
MGEAGVVTAMLLAGNLARKEIYFQRSLTYDGLPTTSSLTYDGLPTTSSLTSPKECL